MTLRYIVDSMYTYCDGDSIGTCYSYRQHKALPDVHQAGKQYSHIVVGCTLTATPPPAATVTDAPAPTWVPPTVCALAPRANAKYKTNVRSPEDFILPNPEPETDSMDSKTAGCPDSSKAGKKNVRGKDRQRTVVAYVDLTTQTL